MDGHPDPGLDRLRCAGYRGVGGGHARHGVGGHAASSRRDGPRVRRRRRARRARRLRIPRQRREPVPPRGPRPPLPGFDAARHDDVQGGAPVPRLRAITRRVAAGRGRPDRGRRPGGRRRRTRARPDDARGGRPRRHRRLSRLADDRAGADGGRRGIGDRSGRRGHPDRRGGAPRPRVGDRGCEGERCPPRAVGRDDDVGAGDRPLPGERPTRGGSRLRRSGLPDHAGVPRTAPGCRVLRARHRGRHAKQASLSVSPRTRGTTPRPVPRLGRPGQPQGRRGPSGRRDLGHHRELSRRSVREDDRSPIGHDPAERISGGGGRGPVRERRGDGSTLRPSRETRRGSAGGDLRGGRDAVPPQDRPTHRRRDQPPQSHRSGQGSRTRDRVRLDRGPGRRVDVAHSDLRGPRPRANDRGGEGDRPPDRAAADSGGGSLPATRRAARRFDHRVRVTRTRAKGRQRDVLRRPRWTRDLEIRFGGGQR